MKNIFLIITLVLIKTITIAQSTASFTVKTDMPTADVQSTMWGIFFEDINLGADGGIYAELIKNRSFEFLKPLMGWKVLPEKAVWQKTIAEERQFQILNRPEKDAPNPRYIHITLNNHQKGDLGLQNEGFRGMGIKKGLRYDFSVLYRLQTGNIKMHLELVNEKGNVIGAGIFSPTVSNGNWNKGEMSFTATDGEGNIEHFVE